MLKRDKLDRSLAAILTLNTIAHTVGAIGAGAEATVIFGSAWFGIFSAVMTLMILFFRNRSEDNWRSLLDETCWSSGTVCKNSDSGTLSSCIGRRKAHPVYLAWNGCDHLKSRGAYCHGVSRCRDRSDP